MNVTSADTISKWHSDNNHRAADLVSIAAKTYMKDHAKNLTKEELRTGLAQRLLDFPISFYAQSARDFMELKRLKR